MNRTKTKEREFVHEYIKNGENATNAVKKVYEITNDNYARVKGHREITKPNVRDLIDGYAAKAIKGIQTLAETAENEAVRLKANIDQADRAGYKPVERSINMNVEIEVSPEIKELAEKLDKAFND